MVSYRTEHHHFSVRGATQPLGSEAVVRPVCPGAVPRVESALRHGSNNRALFHGDVPASGLAARAWQYVVSVYLWRQRRGLPGTLQVSSVLPAGRTACRCGADRDLSTVAHRDGGSERGDCGGAWRISPAVSTSARADLVLRVRAVPAGMGCARRMVRNSVSEWN